ncbi:hypothetical protein OIU77_018494 [Salix suchowensis]|uniref:Rubber elongation factor n=1 Tax=Salix suchowensis TaxID=1278906 RepID=A0ABQ9CGK6_9ROSI|nr:hypothetical protein OIU77_018494 [Salix suchowensis]
MAENDVNMQQQLDKEEEERRLKYLQFVQVAAVHAVLTFTNLYIYAKDKTGPLKPGVETVEGTVKSVVGPVYDKFRDVPIEFLKFVDRKVDESVTNMDNHVPPLVKQVSSRALLAAQNAPVAARAVASEVQRAGVKETASELAKKCLLQVRAYSQGALLQVRAKGRTSCRLCLAQAQSAPTLPSSGSGGCANCRLLF